MITGYIQSAITLIEAERHQLTNQQTALTIQPEDDTAYIKLADLKEDLEDIIKELRKLYE